MALIGVTHCPSCRAVVNANWKMCLACSFVLVGSKHKVPSPQMQEGTETNDESHASMKEKWLNGWRTLANLTSEIEQLDPRFKPLMNFLEQADRAFERDNWEEFQKAASRVRNIANKGS